MEGQKYSKPASCENRKKVKHWKIKIVGGLGRDKICIDIWIMKKKSVLYLKCSRKPLRQFKEGSHNVQFMGFFFF